MNTAAANFQSPLSTNQPPKTAVPAKPGAKLEVDEFVITGGKIHLGTGPTLPLPDIRLHDLGKGPDGITAADLTKTILSEVISGTLKAVESAGVSVGKDAGKAVGAGVNKITTGLGGMFKKSTN